MDGGKKKKVADAMSGDGDGRQVKARKDYKIVTEQFWPLMDKIDAWLEQHKAPKGPEEEEAPASDVEDDGAATVMAPDEQRQQARHEGLADTIRRLLRELDGTNDGGGGSSTAGRASAAGAAEQKP